MISVVLNSAALGEKAKSVLSSGGVEHGKRAKLLRYQILPRLLDDPLVGEVIVAGEWEHTKGTRYVFSPSVKFDCTDALQQRHDGFLASKGDIIVFLHDDHSPHPDFFDTLEANYASNKAWDVLVPRRYCSPAPNCSVALNNGKAEGYVMGHCSVMRRSAVEAVPWNSVKKIFVWDVDHTDKLKKAGQTIMFSDDLYVQDLETELGAEPWR